MNKAMRKIFSVLLAVLMLVAAVPALGETPLPGDSAFAARYNEIMADVLGSMVDDPATAAEMADVFRLTYDEDVGSLRYYNNQSGSLELTFYMNGSAPDSAMITINRSYDTVAVLVGDVLMLTLYDLWGQSMPSELVDWIGGSRSAGDTWPLGDGRNLLVTTADGFTQFGIISGELASDSVQNTGDSPYDSEPGNAPQQTGDNGPLLSWNGFSISLLDIRPVSYSDGTGILRFDARLINGTSRKVYVWIEDAEVDGTPVHGVSGIDLDPGADTGDSEYFFLRPNDDNDQNALQKLMNPGTVRFKIRLMDSDSYQTLYEKSYTFDLSGLGQGIPGGGATSGGAQSVPGGEAASAGGAVEGSLLNWNGFSMSILDVYPVAHADGTGILRFDTRFVNNTDLPIYIWVDDATVDGVSVTGITGVEMAPGTDSGDSEWFFLRPNEDSDTVALQKLMDPGIVSFKVRLMDTNSYQTLYEKSFTFDLTGIASAR